MVASFDFRGVRCFASANNMQTWYFLPRHPDVQRGANGQPMFSLIDMGSTAYLLFTATWSATREDLEMLRHEIVARYPATRADSLVLTFAPIASPRCDVLMGDSQASFEVFASSATSGFPPYDAAFNLQLQGAHVAQAKAALRGELGYLAIEYTAQLRMPALAKASFSTNAADLFDAVQGESSEDILRDALERAIEDGLARVVIDVPYPEASHLAGELYDHVLDRAAKLLPNLLRQGGAGELHVSAELEREIVQPARVFADVGTLFAAETMEANIGGYNAAD